MNGGKICIKGERSNALSHVGRWETHNNVVASRLLKHIRDEFGGNRRSTFILFVLARVGEEGNDGGDSLFALAILQAWIMMQSSMRDVLTWPQPVLTM
jgi:hypothetical protein